MTKSTKVIPRKRKAAGQGRDPLVALRMPPNERKAVEAYAAKERLTLSKAIRHLMMIGIADTMLSDANHTAKKKRAAKSG